MAEPRVALVTGGAGGVGVSVCRRLAERGYVVVAADRAAAFSTPAGVLPEGAVEAALDVSSTSDVERVLRDTDALGVLAAVVTCAGIVDVGPFDTGDDATWQRVLDINLTGTMRVCRAALPRLGAGSAIVTVASIAGRTASTYSSAAYVASKAGVLGLTKSLAAQLGPRGIRVNAVAPGIIETPMIADYGDERKAVLRERIPLGRLGDADEVARAIEFLATDDGSFVTGQVLDVNGGQFIP